MLKKISKVKNIEEILGAIGLLFIMALGFVAFFLIKFLVVESKDSLKPASISKPPVTTFDFGIVPIQQ